MHPGTYMGTIGMTFVVCIGVYCFKQFWISLATPRYWPYSPVSSRHPIVDNDMEGSTHLQMWSQCWKPIKPHKNHDLHIEWEAERPDNYCKQSALAKGVPITGLLAPKAKIVWCNTLQRWPKVQSLILNAVALIFLFKDKIFPYSHLQCQLCLLDLNMTFFKKMENSWSFLYIWTDYSSSRTPLYTGWTIGSAQPECTGLCMSWGEFMLHSLTATRHKKWFICRWNHLGKNDDCPGPRIWESYALPQEGYESNND